MRYFYGAAHEQFPPEALAISSDPEVHADRIREAEKLGRPPWRS
jgi:hypothetical protein